MATQEDTSKALVTLPPDMPALPDLKGKLGGATIKASEEQSTVKEMHKEVRTGLLLSLFFHFDHNLIYITYLFGLIVI